MSDEVSTGELVRRLDEIVRLLQGLVSRVEYTEYQRYVEHRFSELERDIAEKRRIHDRDNGDLRAEIAKLRGEFSEAARNNGVNFRQAIYSGLVPAILLLVTLLVGFLQIKGGK